MGERSNTGHVAGGPEMGDTDNSARRIGRQAIGTRVDAEHLEAQPGNVGRPADGHDHPRRPELPTFGRV